MILNFDHIGILTADLRAVASKLPSWLTLHEEERQPPEGTLEQYATPASDNDPSLLLLQPIDEGPYSAAMEKRGPGLHHIACSTNSLDAAIQHFARHGLLLHPVTVKTYARQSAWMCRPGIPFLVELNEAPDVAPLSQQATLLQLPSTKVGTLDPIDFVPNAVVTATDGDLITIQVGNDVCGIEIGA